MLVARQKVGQDLLALRVADLLQDYLLRGLRADTTELYRRQRLFDKLLDLNLAVAFLGFRQRDLTYRQFHRLVSHHLPAPERLEIPGGGQPAR